MTMLILFAAALFGFGLMLFVLGLAVWLLGLAIRIALWLLQLGLLLVWVGLAFVHWLRQRRKVTVLEGEVLPPQRTLPRSAKLWLCVGMLVLAAAVAHADDWRHRAKEAISGPEPEHQQCVLYADQKDNKLHLWVPICFYNNGDVYLESDDRDLAFTGRKAGALHPAVKCNEIIEGVERIDPTTFLVRLYCKGAVPERDAVSVQLVGETITIRNTEAY
jgi:hypothetical protein